MAYTLVKGSPNESLTIQVARIGLCNKEKVIQKMIKDGYKEMWGPRKQSEWVMQEVNDSKKQKKYARVLSCLWIMQARGILTDGNGRVINTNQLAQAARDATQDVWDLLDIVTKEPRSEVGKAPRVEDILKWQEYASKLKKAIGKTGRDSTSTSADGGIQVAAISPGDLEQAEVEWGEYVKLYPKLPHYSEIDKTNTEPTAPMAPIAIPIPGQMIPGEVEATATGRVGVYRSLGVRDLTSIVNTLPIMKSNSTNADFWDLLLVMARINRLAVRDLYSVCEQVSPVPLFSNHQSLLLDCALKITRLF